jgi:hypothetical protein
VPVINEYEPLSFVVKDSGQRAQFASGMVRDVTEGKTHWWRVRIGPMLRRWAEHVTKAAAKYPDISPMVPNWTLAVGQEERARFLDSLDRHMAVYMTYELTGVNIEDPNNPTREPLTEDHAAAIMFNLNGVEFVKEKMNRDFTGFR